MISQTVARGARYRLNPRRPWAGKACFLLIVAAVGAHQWWGAREGDALRSEVSTLRRLGEPLLVEDFRHAPTDPAENAVVELRLAAAAVPEEDAEWKSIDFDSLAAPLTDAEAERIRQVLEGHPAVLKHVRAARDKPYVDWELPLQTPVLLQRFPEFYSQGGVANMLGAAVLLAAHDGDHALALEHADEICFLARAVDQQPFICADVASRGYAELAARRVGEIAPTLHIDAASAADDAGVAHPEHVRPLIDLLMDPAGPRDGLLRALRGERAWQHDAVRALADGRMALRSLQLVPEENLNWSDYAVRHVIKPSLLADGRIMVRHVGRVLEAAAEPDWPHALPRVPDLRAEFPGHVARHLLAFALTPDYSRYVQRHYADLTNRRLAATALAVRWYATENGGRLPATLDELVPRYLPRVPLDPMASGKPLGYSPVGERPVVYSVGDNGVDDGGSDAPLREAIDDPGPWQCLDVVTRLTLRPRRVVDVVIKPWSPADDDYMSFGIPTPPWADVGGGG